MCLLHGSKVLIESRHEISAAEHQERWAEQKQPALTSVTLSWATGSSLLSTYYQFNFSFFAEQLLPFTHQLLNGCYYFQFTGSSHHQLSAVLCLVSNSQDSICSWLGARSCNVRFLTNNHIAYFGATGLSLVWFSPSYVGAHFLGGSWAEGSMWVKL